MMNRDSEYVFGQIPRVQVRDIFVLKAEPGQKMEGIKISAGRNLRDAGTACVR